MPDLSELGAVLVACRVVAKDRWDRAASDAGGDLDQTLAALADQPPPWWDGKPPAPPGLTEYQQNVARMRFEDNELPRLRRDLAVNHFLLLDKLGQGGQGAVFRARQLNPPRYVAVKTLIRHSELGRHRFEQEARTMMRLQHPAVARFFLYERVRDAAGRPTDEYLIAMEFVNGSDVHRLVRRVGPVPWEFAAHWAADLLGGLAQIHRHGFIHRDLKPENVMVVGPDPGPDVDPDETAAKLLDFGAVKLVDAEDEPTAGPRMFFGTPEYAPPEQWTGQLVAASDLYALGGTLFYMLTGRSPYQLEKRDPTAYMTAHAQEPVPNPRKYNPAVPAELNRVFRRMMAKDPEDRGTAAELLDAFHRLLGRTSEGPPPEPPPPPPKPAPHPKPPPGAPKQPRVPAAETPRHPLERLADPVLAVLERVYIPRRLRPPRGEEPAIGERVAALLRRPAVLVTLLILFVLLIVWVW